MRVVITGGAGFIGANLARSMLDSGMRVIVVDDLSTGYRSNLAGLDVEFHEGTILNPNLLDTAFSGADSVVHLAALPSVPRSIEDPMASHQANATGTVHVLDAVRRASIGHVVVASSSSVYGANPAMPKDEGMRPDPVSPYAVSKLATEAYAVAYHHSFGLDVLPLRFFNVFGPLQRAGHAYAAVVPAFLEAALAGRPLVVHGDGSQTRDFTYVGSVARIITAAVAAKVSYPAAVNLAFGGRTSLNQLVALIERLLGRQVSREQVACRKGDVHESQADPRRLRQLFPSIEPMSLEQGLQATLHWFEQAAPMSGR